MTSSREHTSIVQLHLMGCLIGRFPIYIGKRPIRQTLRWNPIKHQITTNLMHIDTESNDKLKIAYLYRKAIWYLWTNLVPIEFKNTQLEQNQNHKGFPFENFLRKLSTNEKPRFRQDSLYWQNLECTNPMPMRQSKRSRVFRFISRPGPRSFPSIEGNDRGPGF